MGVRSSIAKAFGLQAEAVPEATRESMDVQGMSPTSPFSPSTPLDPRDGYSTTPRTRDFVTGYNIAARPRRNERVAFETLRGLVDAYDVAQACIWHRIDSIRSLAWSVVPMPHVADGGEELVAAAMAILARPDRKLPFKAWLARYLYDVLAYDAGALYRMRNLAGRPVGLKVVDGTTIAPLLDYWGDTPEHPAPAYVQYVQGLPWDWLTSADLIYVPFRPTSNSPYGRAPIETILLNANTDLRFQSYFLQRFTSGTIPGAFATAPEGWTADQIKDFQSKWEAMLYGDQQAKHEIIWVPKDTQFAWSNEKDFSDEFSLFLMRKTCMAYHVVPADLGFTEDVNRATSDTQVDVQFRVGDLPLIQHVEDVLSDFLWRDLGLPLMFQFDTGQEKEDRYQTAQADKIYIEAGVLGVSEVRERVFGLQEPDGQPVPRFIMTGRSGPVPLSALEAVAGPVDAETGAPVPGGPLPHKPFAPVEGVTPQKPPEEPPLAVQQYGQVALDEAAASGQVVPMPALPAAPLALPVGKGEAAAGIATVTGTYSTPLVGNDVDDDDDEDDASEDVAKAAAAELASFRRFVRKRQRAGTWRQFDFTAISPVFAHRLNDVGRAVVRKDAGMLVAAGLAVVADDTGRVLMIQRALDAADPAAGQWELPGGHIEDGEDPLGAAWREFQEETGLVLPPVPVADGWTASNGVYQGFVARVPSEDALPINAEAGRVLNPDDPDGDMVEVVAWWDPALLEGNPAVRQELAADLPLVLSAIAPTVAKGAVRPKAWSSGLAGVPQHAYDVPLAEHYAPLVAKALAGLISRHAAAQAATAASTVVAKASDPLGAARSAAARAVLAGAVHNKDELEQLIRRVIADGYLAGAHAAADQAGGYVASSAGRVAAGIDWSTWAPGDPGAALQAADGGLADLLTQAGQTVQGITGSTLDQLGNLIAQGLADGSSVDEVAGSLGDVALFGDRALMIAHTETARAMTAATEDTYLANGIVQWTWVLSDGACPECVAAAAGGPYGVGGGAERPPLHPYCRCAISPVASSVTGHVVEGESDGRE